MRLPWPLIASQATDRAMADDAGSYTYADTIEWTASYDVVVLGIGFAGLVAAMEAADAGTSVLICEKAPDGEAGGNSRVCGRLFAYGYDSPETKAVIGVTVDRKGETRNVRAVNGVCV